MFTMTMGKLRSVLLLVACSLCFVTMVTGGRSPPVSSVDQIVRRSGFSDWGKCSKECDKGSMTRRVPRGVRALNSVPCAIFPCLRSRICCELDLTFVIDVSGSMWTERPLVNQFITEFTNQAIFGPHPAGLRAGVLWFNNGANVRLQLIQGLSPGLVQGALPTSANIGGGTNVAPALVALRNMYTTQNGDRCKVCNVAIVLTDYHYGPSPAVQAQLNILKAPPIYNMKFFAIGFDDNSIPPSSDNLDQIASQPLTYYRHKVTALNLSAMARRIARLACQACNQCPRLHRI